MYNDERVTEVDEARVLKDASGGHDARSAYYLIYISEAEMLDQKRCKINRYEPSPSW